jgi:CRISPR-associated protein Cas1
MKKQIKPRQIMLSKRACVFYLEHARVMQKEERVVYLTDTGEPVDSFYNIPDQNTAFLLLGKGTSITDAAARKLAESNVVVGFCGSGGSPLFSAVDRAFLNPLSEYRPTEYMQDWMRIWLNDDARLFAARELLKQRVVWTHQWWESNTALQKAGIGVHALDPAGFYRQIEHAQDTQKLLLAEARWAKLIFKALAQTFKIDDFTREEGKGSSESVSDVINSYIDHGNYIAYGYSASVLNCLGISYALPLLHGKTRRGALVFDIADLIKDAITLPLGFIAGSQGWANQEFRRELIDYCQRQDILDHLFTFVLDVIKKTRENNSL